MNTRDLMHHVFPWEERSPAVVTPGRPVESRIATWEERGD